MLRLFLMTLTLCTGMVSAQADAIEGADARREVYKRVGDIELAAYLIEPDGHRPSDSRPVVVFFFGGGWTGGTPRQFLPQARYLASRGMMAVLADYRVESRHGTSPYECVKDGKSLIRWVRREARRLGIDPARVVAAGGSAGGHVAAAAATNLEINEESDDLTISAVPDALLLFNPVIDNGPGGYGHDRAGSDYKRLSPLHQIRQGLPPALVFLGSEDALIPVDTARRFQTAMRAAGSRSDLRIYGGQAHGFFNHPEFRPGASLVYFQDTMSAADRFLVDLGILQRTPEAAEPPAALDVDEESRVLENR